MRNQPPFPTTTPPSFSFFHVIYCLLIFIFRLLCLVTMATRRRIGESVDCLFFFLTPPLSINRLASRRRTRGRRWRPKGGGDGGAAVGRYVRVIACLFIFDIVSHIIICLSPHPQADGNENGKQEVGGGSRVVGGGEGHGGR